jgi:nicotinate-nucleotide adenylyltransferase
VNIALFGGTFDPIHYGHLLAAEAAARKFRLDQVLFVPTGNPPHKQRLQLTTFPHRYAMVTLACAEDHRFAPSLLETPTPDGRPHYSIETVGKAKKLLGPKTTLYFLLGADAFLDLPHWKDYGGLLDLVNFIVVSRPGFEEGDVSRVVPQELARPGRGSPQSDTVRLRHSTLSILPGVEAPVASRGIREAIRAGRGVAGLVPPLVEQYILKVGLYRPPEARRQQR